MKLDKADQEFRNPKVFYPDPKTIDLDRVLLNLLVLLQCGGTRPATRGRAQPQAEKVDFHLQKLAQMTGVKGFAEADGQSHIAKAWLESDIFDLVNRGKPAEAVSSLRPLHVDAAKIRIARHCRDYNMADAMFAMLDHGGKQTMTELRRYLERGRDPHTGAYDGKTSLDLETLAVFKLTEGLDRLNPGPEKLVTAPPVCVGQARVLCDDVQRLLAYQDDIPRPVMIDYLKTIFGLHVGLYVFRLSRQLSGWLKDKKAHPTCVKCPVYGTEKEPFAECPYKQGFLVDMGGDYRSRMAGAAQASAAKEYGQLVDLTKSILTFNQLLRYAREAKVLGIEESPQEVLKLLASPPEQFSAEFAVRIKNIRAKNESAEEQLAPDILAILDSGLPPFDSFIELITHIRQKVHIGRLTEMVDKLFQKNSEFGALVQGKSRNNPRRWSLGGRLLEVLVQLAVLKWGDTTPKQFHTEPILIEELLGWLESRYGFVIGESQSGLVPGPVTPDEHKAFRENVRLLKDRLREIGFYDDVSDAYNAQTIRPRYELKSQPPNTGHDGVGS